ncbi:MAG: choline-glycine betaine transporter [Candidatus Latescibacterota bacterium]|jgi:hypothetical protein
MLLRLFLLGLLLWAILRFFGRLLAFFFFRRPTVSSTQTKKRQKPIDLDDSQIQDADFKDL